MIKEVLYYNITPKRRESAGMSKILIADDENLIRRLVSDFLSKSGHTALEALDGEQALEQFRRYPDLDLIILDIKMAKLD